MSDGRLHPVFDAPYVASFAIQRGSLHHSLAEKRGDENRDVVEGVVRRENGADDRVRGPGCSHDLVGAYGFRQASRAFIKVPDDLDESIRIKDEGGIVRNDHGWANGLVQRPEA